MIPFNRGDKIPPMREGSDRREEVGSHFSGGVERVFSPIRATDKITRIVTEKDDPFRPSGPPSPCNFVPAASGTLPVAVVGERPASPRVHEPVPQRGSSSTVPSNPNSRLGRAA